MCFCADSGAHAGEQQRKVWLGDWGAGGRLSCCRFEMYSLRWSVGGELACSAACLCSPDPEDKSLQSEKDFSKWCGKQAEKKEGIAVLQLFVVCKCLFLLCSDSVFPRPSSDFFISADVGQAHQYVQEGDLKYCIWIRCLQSNVTACPLQ